jgi:phenylpropionate dioxygenase-like ring-hydroxylating dioxygenase large terminal subunit
MTNETSSRLEELETKLHDCAGRPPELRITLPPETYYDPDWFALERARVHEKDWLLLGHVSELPRAGSYLSIDVLDEPLFLVRDEEESLRVLSRVCRHRGVDMRPEKDAGRTRAFVCPYHHWSYKLSGKLRNAPLMDGSEAFDPENCALPEFRHEIWNGFVFVAFDPDARPLAKRLGHFEARLGNWRLADMRVVRKQDWPAPWNWKIMVENFVEGYHHIGTHARSLEPIWPANTHETECVPAGTTMLRFPNSEDYLTRRVRRDAGAGAEGLGAISGLLDADLEASLVLSILPSLTGFLVEDRAYIFRILPTGPESTSLTTYELIHEELLQAEDAEAKLPQEFEMFDTFHQEDLALLAQMTGGLKARTAAQGALSPLEEPIWQLQRYLSGKFRENGA